MTREEGYYWVKNNADGDEIHGDEPFIAWWSPDDELFYYQYQGTEDVSEGADVLGRRLKPPP